MTPIEIIEGRYGAKILTGTTETDLTALKVVAIVVRTPGATFAKLAVNTTDIVTARGLGGVALDTSDIPLIAGYDMGSRSTKYFTNIQMTSANDSVWLIFGE